MKLFFSNRGRKTLASQNKESGLLTPFMKKVVVIILLLITFVALPIIIDDSYVITSLLSLPSPISSNNNYFVNNNNNNDNNNNNNNKNEDPVEDGDNTTFYEPICCSCVLDGFDKNQKTSNPNNNNNNNNNNTNTTSGSTVSYDNFEESMRKLIDPNDGQIYARNTTTDVPFQISIHSKQYDPPRWRIMGGGNYYEYHMVRAFQDILKNYSLSTTVIGGSQQQQQQLQVRVIDVGANIGFYSLLSASMGSVFSIDAFEPNAVNVFRFCQSLHMNNWNHEYYHKQQQQQQQQQQQHKPSASSSSSSSSPHINLYPYGVGEHDGMAKFFIDLPGKSSFFADSIEKERNAVERRVITLDEFAIKRGWIRRNGGSSSNNNNTADHHPPPPRNIEIAVLKIDVEGLENTVIYGAKQLLSSGIVKNIFMELTVQKKKDKLKYRPALQLLVSFGYKLHAMGGSRGPDNLDIPWPQDINLPTKLIDYGTTHKNQLHSLNVWWKL